LRVKHMKMRYFKRVKAFPRVKERR